MGGGGASFNGLRLWQKKCFATILWGAKDNQKNVCITHGFYLLAAGLTPFTLVVMGVNCFFRGSDVYDGSNLICWCYTHALIKSMLITAALTLSCYCFTFMGVFLFFSYQYCITAHMTLFASKWPAKLWHNNKWSINHNHILCKYIVAYRNCGAFWLAYKFGLCYSHRNEMVRNRRLSTYFF